MSENIEVCRVCLATEVPMSVIAGTSLQLVYERLTNSALPCDSLPVSACYMCSAQLRKSYELMETAAKSMRVLIGLLKTKVTKETLSLISPTNNLSGTLAISPTRYVDIDIDATVPPTNVTATVKAVNIDRIPPLAATKHEDVAIDATVPPENLIATVPTVNIDAIPPLAATKHVDVYIDATVPPENLTATLPPTNVTVTIPAVNNDIVPPECGTMLANIPVAMSDIHCDVKPVPDDVQSTVGSVEEEARPEWKHNIKLEIKEEPLDFEETPLSLTVTFKNGDEGSGSDDDDIPLRSLSDKQRDTKRVKKENEGGPAQSSPVNQKIPTDAKKHPTTESITPGTGLVCNYCQRHFKYASEFKRHLRVHTNERPHECNVCKIRFKLLANLKKHFVIHTGETYSCDVCNSRFSHLCSLQRHKRIHTGEKPYTCNVCQKSFMENSVLKRHMLVHTGEKPHQCNICTRRFTTSTLLKKHVLTHNFECDICHSTFASKDRLKVHIRKHVDKPNSCDICGRSFKQKSTLNRHVRAHNGDKPHSCNLCGYRASEYYLLKKHLRTHTGEKPFECDVCHSRFVTRDSLRKHSLVHTGERPFQCKVCNRWFRQMSTLSKHSKTCRLRSER